ncbi:hypothetical protein AB0I00_12160 [Streptomyces sp. NPDC050803]|uniref:hypothetical protein n=1 Tax=unclassified Streptomyces TaxID=2593676 RepID=UPI00343057B5
MPAGAAAPAASADVPIWDAHNDVPAGAAASAPSTDVPTRDAHADAPDAAAPAAPADVPTQDAHANAPAAAPTPTAATPTPSTDAPSRDAHPTPTQVAQPSTSTAPSTPTAPNASTELASRTWSEVRSETPVRGAVQGSPRAAGVSLVRAEAETERRQVAAVSRNGPDPNAVTMPPGELPGPAVPAGRPRRGGRRSRLVAAAGVVVAGAAVAVALAANSGSPDGGQAGSSPSSSYSKSPSSSPTVGGTSRPQSLPPGAHEEAGGFAWATPEGWRRDVKTGAEVHYTSPDGRQELVAKSSIARGDLMETWETSEQNARQGQDYRKIRLEETTFRGHPAVVWEYTFTLKGVSWHAQLLGFNESGKSYQVNTWYQPEIEPEALKTYDKVKDSFTVL